MWLQPMLQPHFTLTISASVVAWYAALVSTITGALQMANFLRDRKKVKLTLARHMAVAHDPRRAGKTFAILRVTNSGRRPLTVTGVYFYDLGNTGALLNDTSPALPHQLTEGQTLLAFLAHISDLNSTDETFRLAPSSVFMRGSTR